MSTDPGPAVSLDVDALAWDKQGGLLPAIVQDARSRRVLMLGYMDRAALDATLATGRVTFYSRSKQRLWMKGESTGNVLSLVSLEADCDADTLLVQARPAGPTCHLDRPSCFPAAPATAAPSGRFRCRTAAAAFSRSCAAPQRQPNRPNWRPNRGHQGSYAVGDRHKATRPNADHPVMAVASWPAGTALARRSPMQTRPASLCRLRNPARQSLCFH